MATDRQYQVNQLFEAALVLHPEQRKAVLGALDPSLREEVESLFASHQEAESSLEKPPLEGAIASPEQPDAESVTQVRTPEPSEGKLLPSTQGEYIGEYRVLREIGHGGMGVVYEAEQQHPRRSVALKVIRGERFADEYHVRLFQREAQALARLKHPGIANIYEAGRTEEGQHFFAMELVTGEPLSEYLSRRPKHTPWKAELRFRLELFVKICEAVNYAHQRGVIHRDLKPGNILVIEEGESGSRSTPTASAQIKILDFGLARVTDPDAADITSMSAMGHIQGTLPYMSPEQAKGIPGDIDVRTDVYSLGVIVYEMVTSQKPYKVDPTAPLEALRVICQEPPQRPNQAIGDSGRRLDLDAETILLKALEKEPSDRYQSVMALTEDIERYLSDRPILAHPPNTMYQLRKLVSRNKVGFGFAATVFLLIVALAVIMTVQSARIAAERDRAEHESTKATAINEFLQETLGSADPFGGLGRDVTVVEALGEAVKQIEESFKGQHEVEAAIKNTIGYTYMELGRYEAAEPLLISALAIREAAFGAQHVEVAESIFHLGLLHLERGDPNRNDNELAEKHFTEALAMRRKLLGEVSLETADVLNALGVLRGTTADYESVALLRESLEIRRMLLAKEHVKIAQSLGNLAAALQDNGQPDEAEGLYREALAMRRKMQGNHPDVANILENLAISHFREGSNEEAAQLFSESIGIYERALDPDHWHLANARSRYGTILTRLGRYEQAEEVLLVAHPVLLSVLGEQNMYTQAAVRSLIDLYESWGKPEKAAEYRTLLEGQSSAQGQTKD